MWTNLGQTWKKVWVPDRSRTHDLPATGRALYTLSTHGEHGHLTVFILLFLFNKPSTSPIFTATLTLVVQSFSQDLGRALSKFQMIYLQRRPRENYGSIDIVTFWWTIARYLTIIISFSICPPCLYLILNQDGKGGEYCNQAQKCCIHRLAQWIINREWGHYREISDRGLDVLTEW